MKIVTLILTIIIFSKTLSYGIFEINEKNKSGGIVVIIVAIISLILPNITVHIMGI